MCSGDGQSTDRGIVTDQAHPVGWNDFEVGFPEGRQPVGRRRSFGTGRKQHQGQQKRRCGSDQPEKHFSHDITMPYVEWQPYPHRLKPMLLNDYSSCQQTKV